MAVITFTDKNFDEEVLKSDVIVLVDFWSPMCPPCRMLAPIIEEIAEEFKGKAKIGKLNVLENPKKSDEYQIISIPTLVIFKNGEIKSKIFGWQSKEEIANKLNSFL